MKKIGAILKPKLAWLTDMSAKIQRMMSKIYGLPRFYWGFGFASFALLLLWCYRPFNPLSFNLYAWFNMLVFLLVMFVIGLALKNILKMTTGALQKFFRFCRVMVKWLILLLLSWAVGISLVVVFVALSFSSFLENISPTFLGSYSYHADSCDGMASRNILEIDSSAITERPYQHDKFPKIFAKEGIAPTNWLQLRKTLQQAQHDSRITGVLLRYQGMMSGDAGLTELAALLSEFHTQSGKAVWIYSHGYGTYHGFNDYMLFESDYHILLPPSGYVEISPFATERFYVNRLLKHWEIAPEFMRRHEYKAAPSQYTSSAPSDAELKNIKALLADMAEIPMQVLQRKMEIVEPLIKQQIFSAADAQNNGLVHALIYEDELEDYLTSQHGDESEILPIHCYGQDEARTNEKDAKHVQMVHVTGMIVPPALEIDEGISTLFANIEEARDDDDIDALLVYIDSPGGDYATSEHLWHMLYEFPKPVAVLMGNVAASGGYFVASGADKIFAYPNTITGSIGIYSGHFALRDFLKNKLYIDSYLISNSPYSHSSLDRYAPERREQQEKFIDALYDDFTQKINLQRKFSPEALDDVARGRVFSGKDAHALGLIDGVGGFTEAMDWFSQELNAEIIFVPETVEQNFENIINDFFASLFQQKLRLFLYEIGILDQGVRMQLLP